MIRDLLNQSSDWVIGPVLIGISVGLALTAWALVRRFLPAWRDAASGDTIAGVAAMVMTLFALVLAFVVVDLYNGYVSAEQNVSTEASSLGALIREAHAFPHAARGRIDGAVANYVTEVREREFTMLRKGKTDPEASRRLTVLFSAVQSYSPVTQSQLAFYRAVTDQLDTIATERQKRVESAETSIPGPLLALMIITALVTLATTVLVTTHRTGVDIALVVSVGVIVGAGIFTALILEYPFSGSIAVSSSPLAHAAAGV